MGPTPRSPAPTEIREVIPTDGPRWMLPRLQGSVFHAVSSRSHGTSSIRAKRSYSETKLQPRALLRGHEEGASQGAYPTVSCSHRDP